VSYVPFYVVVDDVDIGRTVALAATGAGAATIRVCKDAMLLESELANVPRAVVVLSLDEGRTGLMLIRRLLTEQRWAFQLLYFVVLTPGLQQLPRALAQHFRRVQCLAAPPCPAMLAAHLAGLLARLDEDESSRTDGDPTDEEDDGDRTIVPIRRPLNRMAVVEAVRRQAGVIAVFDGDGRPLSIEWSPRARDRLRDYARAVTTYRNDRRAASFEFFPTSDPDQVEKVLHRWMNTDLAQPSPAEDRKPQHVTDFATCRDPALLDKLRSLAAEHPQDPDVLEWLAYTMYANGLLAEAISCYHRRMEVGLPRQEHVFYCGNAYYKLGAPVLAADYWRRTVAMNPTSRIGRKAAARLSEGGSEESQRSSGITR